MRKLSSICALLVVMASSAVAQDAPTESELNEILRVKLRTVQHMALNPVLVSATREQNGQRLTLAEIKKRDEEWKATKEETPFKRELMANQAAVLLRSTVGDGVTFTEAFLTDNQGANVAVYPPTSDYWQGDEEKWTASFADGDGVMFIGPLEFDDSTKKYAVQISAPVKDGPDTIGVLVVGVSVDYVSTHQ